MAVETIGRSLERPATFGPEPGSPGGEQDSFRGLYPCLYGFLADLRETTGWQKTGTITVFVENGHYKICLNDRPEKRSAFVTGSTLAATLRAAESGIQSNTVPWRKKGYKAARER